MEGTRTKKRMPVMLRYVGSVIGVLFIIGLLASPEISAHFKNRDVLSKSDLKQEAIKKFDQYKRLGEEDSQRTMFAELGSTKFPYSMDYKYFIDSSVNDEKLYLYSQAREDWILVSETKRNFDNQTITEMSDWNALAL